MKTKNRIIDIYWITVQTVQKYILDATDKVQDGFYWNGKKRIPKYILSLKKEVSSIDFMVGLKQFGIDIDKLLPYQMKWINDKVETIKGHEHYEWLVKIMPTENIYDLSIYLYIENGLYIQCVEDFLLLQPLTFPKAKRFDVFSVDYTETLKIAEGETPFDILLESLVNSQLNEYFVGNFTKNISKDGKRLFLNNFFTNETSIVVYGKDYFFNELVANKSSNLTELLLNVPKHNYWKVKINDHTFKLYQMDGHLHFNISTPYKIKRKAKTDYVLGEFKKWTFDFAPIPLTDNLTYCGVVNILVNHLKNHKTFIESLSLTKS